LGRNLNYHNPWNRRHGESEPVRLGPTLPLALIGGGILGASVAGCWAVAPKRHLPSSVD
jgi:hypothetical protein